MPSYFTSAGFSAVGVDEIGRQAGVSGPAIYRHFKSKDDILAALFDQGLHELASRTAQVFEDPLTEIRYLVTQHAGAILARPKLASIWIHEGRSLSVTDGRRFHRRRSDAYLDRWVKLIGRAYPEADETDVEVLARSAVGSTGWTRPAIRVLKGLSGSGPDTVITYDEGPRQHA